MTEKIYRASKKKIALMGLLIIGALMITIPLYYLLDWLSSNYTGTLIYIAWILISIIPILVALSLILVILNLISTKYALILNENGVELKTTFGKSRLIKWYDINSLELKERFFNKTIVVHLKDSQAYIQQLSPLMQKGVPGLMTRFGSPCILEIGSANGKPDDILLKTQEFLEMYGKQEPIV